MEAMPLIIVCPVKMMPSSTPTQIMEFYMHATLPQFVLSELTWINVIINLIQASYLEIQMVSSQEWIGKAPPVTMVNAGVFEDLVVTVVQKERGEGEGGGDAEEKNEVL
ncbi:hypothetical protein C8R44DRAFT_742475 [Mycena epipterygia]|nr:hypothetical protein C8R44DRAFT_742475 [Mycena epipterygia]